MKSKHKGESANLIKFRNLIPGILSLLLRLPSVIKTLKLMKVTGEDRRSLGVVLEENAERYPDKTAILYEDVRFTYDQVNRIVNQYAAYFRSLGVQKGETVAVMLENRPEFIFVVSALAKLGAISGLINTNQRGAVLKHSFDVLEARILIIGEETIDAFEDIRPNFDFTGNKVLCFVPEKRKQVMPDGFVDLMAVAEKQTEQNPGTTNEVLLKDTSFYIFTSGTTGMPKAVILKHAKWVMGGASLSQLVLRLNSDDVVYCSVPLFHNTGITIAWAPAWSVGGAVAITRKFSASRFLPEVRKFKATVFVYIGELCRYLMNTPLGPEGGKSTLKKAVGAGLRPDIWKEFKKRYHFKQIAEFYGATEFNFSFVNFLNIDNTVGLSLTPYAIVEYDMENEAPVRDDAGYMKRVQRGEAGLLLGEISANVAFDGYTDKEATEKKILRDVFQKGDAWANTGDIVIDQGYRHIQFADRMGDTFRWKGENVSTTEVEEVIGKCDQVAQAAVYGVEIKNTDGRAGMGCIVPNCKVQEFDLGALSAVLHKNLPAYAIPKFIRLKKEFEATATFKVNKNGLRKEGFDPQITNDPTFVLLPGKDKYEPLSKALYDEIMQGKHRF